MHINTHGISLIFIVITSAITLSYTLSSEGLTYGLDFPKNYQNVICSANSSSYIGFMMENKISQYKAILGEPTSFYTYIEDSNTYYQNFTNGAIYWTMALPSDTGDIPLKTVPYEIDGGIYNKWKEMGLESSFLGYPITDEQYTPYKDGRFSAFQKGAIYWSPSSGAHEIHGDIFNKWKEMGLESSFLGYPITDVQPLMNGDAVSYFEGGLIRWSEKEKELHVLDDSQVNFATDVLAKSPTNYTQERIIDDLRLSKVSGGIEFPTSMAFLGTNDLLVLEKNKGTVIRVVNGTPLSEPLVDQNVSTRGERGMLGIAVAKSDKNLSASKYDNLKLLNGIHNDNEPNKGILMTTDSDSIGSNTFENSSDIKLTSIIPRNGTTFASLDNNATKTYVFLYFTQAKTKDTSDLCEENIEKELVGNRLYRYELTDNDTKLSNPKLLLALPPLQSPVHNGGKMLIGPDDYIYLIVGDLQSHNSTTQNLKKANKTDGTSVVYRLTFDGHPAPGNPFRNDSNTVGSFDKFFAYGIRNSFGIDIDPLTGKLWDTENNENNYDEINLVEPGFNSGWLQIQGLSKHHRNFDPDLFLVNSLVNGSMKGKYMDPKFVWNATAGLTALKFYSGDKLGKHYYGNMFVADINNENLYRFELADKRDDLMLTRPYSDRVADNRTEVEQLAIAQGFGSITEIQQSPDGYMYLATIKEYYPMINGDGTIYKVEQK
ncbi:PQQ-dependent sugar dehydrogenase [Candidatus Nitrosocosmicus sp. R]